MPYARSAKRTYKKRRTPALRRRAKPKAAGPRRRTYGLSSKPSGKSIYSPPRPQRQVGYLPFAPVMRVRLPYVETLSLTAPALGTSGVYYFNLNSLYDPNLTSTGHQPMQFDQLAGIYKSYIVHGCGVELEYSNPNGDGAYVGYSVRTIDSYSAAGDPNGKTIDELSEMRNCTVKPIMNTGRQRVHYKTYIPMATLFQLPRMVYNADRGNYAASVAANPAKSATLALVVIDPLLNQIATQVRVRLTYFAELYDMVPQGQSA